MEQILLSIIVPIYNVENFIGECIESLINQSIEDYEIICVDDGSTDKSIEIVKLYKSDKIKIISQSNEGLSAARNTGLKEACGEYVMFVDSDDFIKQNSLKEIVTHIKEEKLDLLAYNFINYYSNSKMKIEIRNIPQNKSMDGLSYYKIMFNDNSCPMSWLNIYNRDFLMSNNLWFEVGIIHEDVEFLIRLLVKVKKMQYVNNPIYFYRKRDGSIMNSKKYNPQKIPSLYKIIETYEIEMKNYKNDYELMMLLKKRKLNLAYKILREYTNNYNNINLTLAIKEQKYLRSIFLECGGLKHKSIALTTLGFNVYIYIKRKKRLILERLY